VPAPGAGEKKNNKRKAFTGILENEQLYLKAIFQAQILVGGAMV